MIEGESTVSVKQKFALANDTHPAASIGTSAARVVPTNHRSCEIVKLVPHQVGNVRPVGVVSFAGGAVVSDLADG